MDMRTRLDGIGGFPVLGHALAVGHAAQHHLVADGCVDGGAELDGLVDLGEHRLLGAGLERGDGVVQRVAVAAGVEHQQAS